MLHFSNSMQFSLTDSECKINLGNFYTRNDLFELTNHINKGIRLQTTKCAEKTRMSKKSERNVIIVYKWLKFNSWRKTY